MIKRFNRIKGNRCLQYPFQEWNKELTLKEAGGNKLFKTEVILFLS